MFPGIRLGLALPLALLALFLPLISSLPHDPREVIASGTLLRILPLGDSITFGYQGGHGTNGYRAELNTRLAGSKVDFVGTLTSGTMADNQNEGHSGYTISQIAGVMQAGLNLKPNVVLLHAGTNDLNRAETTAEPWSAAPARLSSLIDGVLKTNPNALIIVAKIIPATNAATNGRIKTFNAAIPAVVQAKVNQGHKVTLVDQSVISTAELLDGIHPTDAGYAHMGDIWFEALKAAAGKGLVSAPA